MTTTAPNLSRIERTAFVCILLIEVMVARARLALNNPKRGDGYRDLVTDRLLERYAQSPYNIFI